MHYSRLGFTLISQKPAKFAAIMTTVTANIESLLKADRAADALAAADQAIASGTAPSAHLLFLKGKSLWRLGRRSEATSAYAASASLDPDGPAVRALEHARDIDAFFNHDLYNP